jgi:cytochrome c553
MKTKYLSLIAFAVSGFFATSAFSGEPAADIAKRSCELCHGPAGVTTSELFPQLAGQPAPYLINQLKAFRNKTRRDQNAQRFMWGIAALLTDDDIHNLAAYFQAQTPAHIGKITDQAQYDKGKEIFTTGLEKKDVPPCMDCHGEKGEGIETTPRLGGQHEVYLKRQLHVFFGKDRPAADAMHQVVKGLADKDIDAVAQYLQAQ